VKLFFGRINVFYHHFFRVIDHFYRNSFFFSILSFNYI